MNEVHCTNIRCRKGLPTKSERFKCDDCGDVFCGRHIYSYVDGNNEAITKNSPELCARCYTYKYRGFRWDEAKEKAKNKDSQQ